MTHSQQRDDKVNDQVDDLNSGFCWGAEAIGAVIGRNSAHRMTRQQFDQAVQDLIRAAMSTGLSFQEAKKAVENGLKNDR